MDKLQGLLKYVSKEELSSVLNIAQEAFNLTPPIILTEWKGHIFTPPFSSDTAEFIYNKYEPTKQDVYIVSYPKTGKKLQSKQES